MKREDQKRNKELQKNLSSILKECPKTYKEQKLKKKDYLLWTIRDNMIFNFFPSARIREIDLKPVLSVHINYKPLWVDNLLWDILGMELNKQESDSLRVVGAFTAIAAKYDSYVIELPAEDAESIKTMLFEKIDEFLDKIDELDESRYVNQIISTDLISNLDKALVYIHLGKINEAKDMVLSSKDGGRFSVGGVFYKELAMKYLGIKE